MSASLSIEAHEIGSSLFRMNYSLSQETRTSICLTRGVRWSFNTCLIVAVLSSYVGVGESLRHVKGMQRVSITQRFSGSIEKWTHFTIVRACSWFGLLDTLRRRPLRNIYDMCCAVCMWNVYFNNVQNSADSANSPPKSVRICCVLWSVRRRGHLWQDEFYDIQWRAFLRCGELPHFSRFYVKN